MLFIVLLLLKCKFKEPSKSFKQVGDKLKVESKRTSTVVR